MSDDIIWKAFKLGELFERSTKLALNKNQKELNLSDVKDDEHSVALVSASRNGSGIIGYLHFKDYDSSNVSINKITFDDQWGYTFFQNQDFIITGGHNAILEVKETKLKEVLDSNIIIYSFISILINKITIKSNLFSYNYKINNKFDRELILLPVIKVSSNDSYIWESNNNYYSLAIDYIKELMDKAKQIKEQRTIKLYESERARYESERARYEQAYLKEQETLIWKAFKLGELFEISTEHYLEKSKKHYDISQVKTDFYSVAVCSASKQNNGIVGYIAEIDDVPQKKRKGFLTKGGFGHCFYQKEWFIKPGGSWGMLDIIKIKDSKLKAILDQDDNNYYFLAKMITKIMTPMSSWSYSVPFDRELILLPIIKVSSNDSYIWESNNNYYSLAKSTMSYLYLTGQINIQQKKIDSYS